MELLSKSKSTVTEVTYVLQHPAEGIIHYKEWIDQSGKIIESIVRSKNGYEIDDQSIVEEVWRKVDELEKRYF